MQQLETAFASPRCCPTAAITHKSGLSCKLFLFPFYSRVMQFTIFLFYLHELSLAIEAKLCAIIYSKMSRGCFTMSERELATFHNRACLDRVFLKVNGAHVVTDEIPILFKCSPSISCERVWMSVKGIFVVGELKTIYNFIREVFESC